jgi:spore coat protein U-like protein
MTKMQTASDHTLMRALVRLARRFACVLALALVPASPALARIVCAAANVTLNYGAYDVLSGSALDVGGTIAVTCTKSGTSNNVNGNISYSVALTPLTPRTLVPASGTALTHQLYIDSARTQPWGNGTVGTFAITGTVSVNKNATVTDVAKNFYASVTPGGQDVAAGTYSTSKSPAVNFTVTVTCTSPAATC